MKTRDEEGIVLEILKVLADEDEPRLNKFTLASRTCCNPGEMDRYIKHMIENGLIEPSHREICITYQGIQYLKLFAQMTAMLPMVTK